MCSYHTAKVCVRVSVCAHAVCGHMNACVRVYACCVCERACMRMFLYVCVFACV